MRQVSLSNNVQKLIDIDAKVSVCSVKKAKLWVLLDRLQPSQAKIHPYNSRLILVKETALCITNKYCTILIEFFVLPGSSQPILDDFRAAQLTMDRSNTLVNPVKMLQGEREVSGEFNFRICSILEKYTANFHGLGKMKD